MATIAAARAASGRVALAQQQFVQVLPGRDGRLELAVAVGGLGQELESLGRGRLGGSVGEQVEGQLPVAPVDGRPWFVERLQLVH